MQKWRSVSVSNDNVLRAWSLCIHPLSDHSYQSLPFLLLVIHLQVLFLLHRVFLQMSSTVYSTLSIHGAGKWAWHTAKGGKYCWLWCDSAYGGDEGAAFFFDLRRPQMQHPRRLSSIMKEANNEKQIRHAGSDMGFVTLYMFYVDRCNVDGFPIVPFQLRRYVSASKTVTNWLSKQEQSLMRNCIIMYD